MAFCAKIAVNLRENDLCVTSIANLMQFKDLILLEKFHNLLQKVLLSVKKSSKTPSQRRFPRNVDLQEVHLADGQRDCAPCEGVPEGRSTLLSDAVVEDLYARRPGVLPISVDLHAKPEAPASNATAIVAGVFIWTGFTKPSPGHSRP